MLLRLFVREVVMKRSIVIAMVVAALSIPALPQYYSNGPINGTVDAWTINFGFIVSDSFTFNSPGGIYQLSFGAWLFPGDVLESVEMSITSSEFGGTSYFDEVVNLTQSGCYSNQLGFSVCSEITSLSGPSLNAGTYWLNLQNAVVNTGDPVYWDENAGPSQASQNSVGTIPSESFAIGGCGSNGKSSPDCGPPPTSPEPGSLLLFASGAVAMLGAARRFTR